MATSKRTTSSRSKKSTRSKHERMVLTGKDRDALLAAIANPPAPTAKLVAALKLHRQHCG